MSRKSILIFAFLLIAALVVGTCTACDGVGATEPYFVPPKDLTEPLIIENMPESVTGFDSLEALRAVFESDEDNYGWVYPRLYYAKSGSMVMDDAAVVGDYATNEAAARVDYSETNIQTEGVDEGDIVKTDGEYIYCLNSSGFNIIRVEKGEMTRVTDIRIDDYYPCEMYIDGDTLVLIGGIYEYFDVYDIYGDYLYYRALPYYRYNRKTDIRVYDISDRKNVEEIRHVTVDGYYNTSRMIDGRLYYIVDFSFYDIKSDEILPDYSDSILTDGKDQKMAIGDVYQLSKDDTRRFTLVGCLDIVSGETADTTLRAYIGAGGEVYASEDNIYLLGDEYLTAKNDDTDKKVISYTYYHRTVITKIAYEGLAIKARVALLGSVKDRFCVDEYLGNLRVATTCDQYSYSFAYTDVDDGVYQESDYLGWTDYKVNRVYVLDGDLLQIGIIDNIAEGESIYSCRFHGATGSLVTFETIDPYYNLDLSDPMDPKLSKGLKEDGVSYYIHYLGDSGYTIGVGVDTYVNDYGNAVSAGLKISMYDNRSGEAVNVAPYILGEHGYTPLTYEPKSLLYDERIGLFAFPVSYDDDDYYTPHQGLAVFRFDVEAGKLEYRGLLSNTNDSYDCYYYYYVDTISRGIRIGDHIFTVADSRIVSYDIADLKEVAKIVFVESENK